MANITNNYASTIVTIYQSVINDYELNLMSSNQPNSYFDMLFNSVIIKENVKLVPFLSALLIIVSNFLEKIVYIFPPHQILISVSCNIYSIKTGINNFSSLVSNSYQSIKSRRFATSNTQFVISFCQTRSSINYCRG